MKERAWTEAYSSSVTEERERRGEGEKRRERERKAAEGKRASPVCSGGCFQPWSPLRPFQQCCLAGGSAILPRTQGSLPRTICQVQGIGGLDLTRGSLPGTVQWDGGSGPDSGITPQDCLAGTGGGVPGPDSGVTPRDRPASAMVGAWT